MKIEIYIASHKKYIFPDLQEYIPIQVGKENSLSDLGIIGDNTGDNISNLNKNFCELTALYWIWKNSTADIKGLVHYRRYFECSSINKNFCEIGILDKDYIESKFNGKDFIILAKPRYMRINYRPFVTIKENYCYAHYKKDWEILKSVIHEMYPDYYLTFLKVEKSRRFSGANMMISNKEFFDKYCKWLFDILLVVADKIDLTNYDAYQARIYGFMSERLLNVFLMKNQKNVDIFYQKINNLESKRWIEKFY